MNDAELVVQEAQRWLRFAAEDIDAARRLQAERSSAPRHACRHSQQAAERVLKAALVLEGNTRYSDSCRRPVARFSDCPAHVYFTQQN